MTHASSGTSIGRSYSWLVVAICLAILPFAQGLTSSRIFYIRDLSLFFWGRFLWLRHTIFAGELPWWDPYIGAGQAAYEDALHQMFLLPVLLVRLIPSEVLAFNLWVSLPFPLAAAGAWGFLRRRFSAPAATLGAVACALAGPIVSTSNFPNMSWSVATLPWVLWTVDRLAARPTLGGAAAVALAVAFQAFAGEPVTLFSTLALSGAFAFVVSPIDPDPFGARVRRTWWVGVGLTLGVLLAAIQLVPMASAAALAERSGTIGKDLWSLHPLALLETVSHHLFGDYYATQSLVDVPWMPPLNSGREPFFFSIYFGVPLLALALFGFVSGATRRWTTFWVGTAAIAVIGAFGTYTPIYPLLRDHLPVVSSFRFPVKYLVVVTMSIAAGAAAGWDALQGAANGVMTPRLARARQFAIGTALLVGGAAYVIAGLCLFAATTMAFQFFSIAKMVGVDDPIAAAEFMLRALPQLSTALMLVSVSTAGLIFFGASLRRESAVARPVLYVVIVGDLMVRAWGICPAFDPVHVAQPDWLAHTRSDSDAPFYVGGKRDGTLDPGDSDSSRRFLNPPGLRGSASRAALSTQTVYYPSAWRRRELLSYDLAVLWPKPVQLTQERFFTAGPAARSRFLERAGVRYRVLPERRSEGRTPVVGIPFFEESFLYDWGSDAVARRASVVSGAQVLPVADQIDRLFEPGWDHRTTVLVEREAPAFGRASAPVEPFAKLVADRPRYVALDAGAGSAGGYLVLLDSYAAGWRATVDGQPAEVVRANGIFRSVHLAAGTHFVEFFYQPAPLMRGGAVSLGALLVLIACATAGASRKRVPVPAEATR